MNLRERLQLIQKNKSTKSIPKNHEVTIVKNLDHLPCSPDDSWLALGKGVWFRRTQFELQWKNYPGIPEDLHITVQKRMQDMCAMDTETSGLSGGAGTVAFLAGFSYFNINSIIVEQFFMDDYPAEPEYLNAFLQGLAKHQHVCTYNGSAFDMPILRTRCTMNGIDPYWTTHEDLLPACRRLWKSLYGNARLGTIEQRVLGFYRDEDLPGSEVPQRWFDSLKSGKGLSYHGLHEVFSHHCFDTVSLLILYGLTRTIENKMEQYDYASIQMSLTEFIDRGETRLIKQEKIAVATRAFLLYSIDTKDEASVLHQVYLLLQNTNTDSQENRLCLSLLFIRSKKLNIFRIAEFTALLLFERYPDAYASGMATLWLAIYKNNKTSITLLEAIINNNKTNKSIQKRAVNIKHRITKYLEHSASIIQ